MNVFIGSFLCDIRTYFIVSSCGKAYCSHVLLYIVLIFLFGNNTFRWAKYILLWSGQGNLWPLHPPPELACFVHPVVDPELSGTKAFTHEHCQGDSVAFLTIEHSCEGISVHLLCMLHLFFFFSIKVIIWENGVPAQIPGKNHGTWGLLYSPGKGKEQLVCVAKNNVYMKNRALKVNSFLFPPQD